MVFVFGSSWDGAVPHRRGPEPRIHRQPYDHFWGTFYLLAESRGVVGSSELEAYEIVGLYFWYWDDLLLFSKGYNEQGRRLFFSVHNRANTLCFRKWNMKSACRIKIKLFYLILYPNCNLSGDSIDAKDRTAKVYQPRKRSPGSTPKRQLLRSREK